MLSPAQHPGKPCLRLLLDIASWRVEWGWEKPAKEAADCRLPRLCSGYIILQGGIYGDLRLRDVLPALKGSGCLKTQGKCEDILKRTRECFL